MKQTFYSNGKLLITGEYVVLDGAKAFALPTKFGQNLIIEETLLTKIDQIGGDKNKRAATIETALREFIEREELKEAENPKPEIVSKKVGSGNKRAGV